MARFRYLKQQEVAWACWALLMLWPSVLWPSLTWGRTPSLEAETPDNPIADWLAALPHVPAGLPSGDDWLLDGSKFKAAVYRTGEFEFALDNGLIRRTIRCAPNGATVGIQQRVSQQAILRAVNAEASLRINGRSYAVGGLTGQPNQAYLSAAWISQLKPIPGAFQLNQIETLPVRTRVDWKRVRHAAPDAVWPPRGVHICMRYSSPEEAGTPRCQVEVHYELYDGIPAMSKWLVVQNLTEQALELERLTTETLSVVEDRSWVETREGVALPHPESVHVETDFAFGGFNHENANRHVVHWRPDPRYSTQVNYLKQSPCLLVVEPTNGPAQTIPPHESLVSYTTFELFHDSLDRERQELGLRKFYRVVAPWVTENPLMMHLRGAQPELVRNAIEQCAQTGFEMLILSFGSGFNMENRDPAYVRQWKELADLANSKGVELGGYSLLSSRRIGNGQDIVSPQGTQATHGSCPALTSEWGLEYFRTLRAFLKTTGFRLLEHDGSYPGDVDITPRPPLQKGPADSRWAQWRIIREFYADCRSQGIYLNVPDYYYLCGSNKCGMGYREVNWSLPRVQQQIHTRQNIFDGTRTKTPSMGWMFVPLTQYHGGGDAATIEPLADHLEHYQLMLASNLGAGVQACYRGPRLFDQAQTLQAVQSWTAWYRQHRDILESDVIHSSSRRADGRDLDWCLHANPRLKDRGMLVVYNPLDQPVERSIRLSLYYCGIEEQAEVIPATGASFSLALDARYRVDLPVRLAPGSVTWFRFR